MTGNSTRETLQRIRDPTQSYVTMPVMANILDIILSEFEKEKLTATRIQKNVTDK